MTTDTQETRLLAAVATEHKREKMSRVLAMLGWILTAIALTLGGLLISKASAAYGRGGFEVSAPIYLQAGFVVVLSLAALVMATLSTVGVFLRMRVATLTEIQLRLASLERVFLSQETGRN